MTPPARPRYQAKITSATRGPISKPSWALASAFFRRVGVRKRPSPWPFAAEPCLTPPGGRPLQQGPSGVWFLAKDAILAGFTLPAARTRVLRTGWTSESGVETFWWGSAFVTPRGASQPGHYTAGVASTRRRGPSDAPTVWGSRRPRKTVKIPPGLPSLPPRPASRPQAVGKAQGPAAFGPSRSAPTLARRAVSKDRVTEAIR